jgi:hypothetical protein
MRDNDCCYFEVMCLRRVESPHIEERSMPTARLFNWRNCQAVRLPKGFSFRGREIEIFRRENELILREKLSGKIRRAGVSIPASGRIRRSGSGNILPTPRKGP